MNIAIIDDETHCIESLAIHIHELFPEMEIVYKTSWVKEAAVRLPNLDIDLLFLDIEMPGMNGFELLRQIPDRHFDVIFTTAYSQYALDAFKAKAIDYLLKPIDEEELREVVSVWEKDKKTVRYGGNDRELGDLLDHLEKKGFLKNKIAVPVSEGYEFIQVDDIMYCKSQSNYTTFFLRDNSEIIVSKTIKDVERVLDRFFFMRVHQSYLINPNFMKKYYRNDGGYLEMLDKTCIPVSKARRAIIINLFNTLGKQADSV